MPVFVATNDSKVVVIQRENITFGVDVADIQALNQRIARKNFNLAEAFAEGYLLGSVDVGFRKNKHRKVKERSMDFLPFTVADSTVN